MFEAALAAAQFGGINAPLRQQRIDIRGALQRRIDKKNLAAWGNPRARLWCGETRAPQPWGGRRRSLERFQRLRKLRGIGSA